MGSLEGYEAPARRVPEVLRQREAQAFCSELLTNGRGVPMSSAGSGCSLGHELFDFSAEAGEAGAPRLQPVSTSFCTPWMWHAASCAQSKALGA